MYLITMSESYKIYLAKSGQLELHNSVVCTKAESQFSALAFLTQAVQTELFLRIILTSKKPDLHTTF